MSSVDGGATWHSGVSVNRGTVVQVGIFMSGTGGVYGLGGATLRLNATGAQGDVAQFAAGTDTGRVGPFNFGSATNAIYNTAGGFRIDAASDPDNTNTSAGMTFFQRDPSSGGATFSTANPALVFRFDLFTGAGGSDRSLIFSLDELSRGVATYYSSSNATRPTQAAAALSGGTVFIGVIPTPASPALFVLGMLAAHRRRRAAQRSFSS
jgi:hypothetical protein